MCTSLCPYCVSHMHHSWFLRDLDIVCPGIYYSPICTRRQEQISCKLRPLRQRRKLFFSHNHHRFLLCTPSGSPSILSPFNILSVQCRTIWGRNTLILLSQPIHMSPHLYQLCMRIYDSSVRIWSSQHRLSR